MRVMKRIGRPSTSHDKDGARMMAITIPDVPFPLPKLEPEMTRAMPRQIVYPRQVTGRDRYRVLMAAMREVAEESAAAMREDGE